MYLPLTHTTHTYMCSTDVSASNTYYSYIYMFSTDVSVSNTYNFSNVYKMSIN